MVADSDNFSWQKQGVEKNMLVATSDGAIGLVESVQTMTSTVQLLTSQHLSNDIAIKMSLEDGTSVEGVLQSYDTEKRHIEYLCLTMMRLSQKDKKLRQVVKVETIRVEF